MAAARPAWEASHRVGSCDPREFARRRVGTFPNGTASMVRAAIGHGIDLWPQPCLWRDSADG